MSLVSSKCSNCKKNQLVLYPGTEIIYVCVLCDQVIACKQNHSGRDEDRHVPVDIHDHLMPAIQQRRTE